MDDSHGDFRRHYLCVCGAQFALFCSFFMLFQFPLYIKLLGGSERAIGWMMASQTLIATLAIPFLGPRSDSIALHPMMRWGILITCGSTLAFLGIHHVDAWMAATLMIRGMGFALFINAAGAYVARILPLAQRSRGMSVLFGLNQLAVALGPALGELIIETLGFAAFFLVSALLSATALPLVFWAKSLPPLPRAQNTPWWSGPRYFFQSLFVGRVGFLFVTLLAIASALGAVFNLSATFLQQVGISSGLFFVVYAFFNAGVRFTCGGLSDRYGRAIVAVPTLVLMLLGLVLYGFTTQIWQMLLAASLIGLGFGMANPVLMAEMLDFTSPTRVGMAVGGFHFAYQSGMLISLPLMGALAQSLGYLWMWQVTAFCCLCGILIYLLGHLRGKPADGTVSESLASEKTHE